MSKDAPATTPFFPSSLFCVCSSFSLDVSIHKLISMCVLLHSFSSFSKGLEKLSADDGKSLDGGVGVDDCPAATVLYVSIRADYLALGRL